MQPNLPLATVLIVIGILRSSMAVAAGDDSLLVLRDHFVQDVLYWPAAVHATSGPAASDDPATLLDKMQVDGNWVDLSLASGSDWSYTQHLTRLLSLAQAYRDPQSTLCRDARLLRSIITSLDYWLDARPVSTNWWWNQIGWPRTCGRLLILLDDELTPELLDRGVAFMDQRGNTIGSGQNRIWLEEVALMIGVLRRDEDGVAAAWRAIEDVVEIAPGRREGIKPDMSFYQHGPQLMSGTYGLSFTIDLCRLAQIADGTPYAFTPRTIALLEQFLLDGQRWMMRGSRFDYSATGREITRRFTFDHGRRVGRAIRQFLLTNPSRADELMAWLRQIEADDPANHQAITGNRHFRFSDYMAHHRPGFFFSIRMSSSRTIGSELVNGEGLQSGHLGDGVTLLYLDGHEYDGIFPLWQWARLPGITAPQTEGPPPAEFRNSASFVGGVSDGEFGMAAMVCDKGGVRAHKAWACLGDIIVALGADISAPSVDTPIYTTINQTWQRGSITLQQAGAHSSGEWMIEAPTWVHHGDVGYVVLDASGPVTARAAEQTGNWQRINRSDSPEPLRGNVFTLWIDHGQQPTAGRYAYLIAPNRTPHEVAAIFQQHPITILSNNVEIQAVRDERSGMVHAAFYAPGRLDLCDGRSLEIDHPALIMLRPLPSGDLELSAANPLREPLTLGVTLRRPSSDADAPRAGEVFHLELSLPAADDAGSTIRIQAPIP